MKTSDIKIKPWLLPWLGEPDENEELPMTENVGIKCEVCGDTPVRCFCDAHVPGGTRYVETLEDLVQCLIDNDPDEPIADNGMTVLDGWRENAKRTLRCSQGGSDYQNGWNAGHAEGYELGLNSRASQAQSEASSGVEPVAWRIHHPEWGDGEYIFKSKEPRNPDKILIIEPLYASLPPSASQASCSPPESNDNVFSAVTQKQYEAEIARLHDVNRHLTAALNWYADATNRRRGMHGSLQRNGNRNTWVPDDGDMARAALSRDAQQGEAK